eukprot:TRINITY_DN23173_c2_g2_i1.p1 TRINITY_DN23173_c2_g2~~TRINITY_DN23173_c2_g2_i1.p1  ORF type:complete len:444 (+),score=70.01 TRINITY_DN23173_c2_g2_i1:109-1440(+)
MEQTPDQQVMDDLPQTPVQTNASCKQKSPEQEVMDLPGRIPSPDLQQGPRPRDKMADGLQSTAERLQIFDDARALPALTPYARADHVHAKLTPEFWGISLRQMLDFVSMVRERIDQEGLVNLAPNYDQEIFDNPKQGPNMYAVLPLIKEQTAKEELDIPYLSYAVMKNAHTAGLKCDVFISHAWAEPVFEFGQNIDSAWPLAADAGAYFCCLSNPQHLDISSMIATPSSSPFYRVLEGCRPKVVLLSNSLQPIHSRLWCVYEVFVAGELGLNVAVGGNREDLVTDRRAAAQREKELEGSRAAYYDNGLWTDTFVAFCWCWVCSGECLQYHALLCGLESARPGSKIVGHDCYAFCSGTACVCAACFGTCCTCFRYCCDGTKFWRDRESALRKKLALKQQMQAVDVRKAMCSSASDETTIWKAIGSRAAKVNSDLQRLIFNESSR